MIPQQIISKKNDSPILIVDRVGIIGESLTNKLKDEATIVFVSEKPLDLENTIHIQFGKKFPAIPDNTYSYVFVVDDRSSIRDFLPNFLEKAKNDRAGFVFITSVLEESAELIDKITNLKGKIVFFGDVFPKNLILQKFNISIVNKFINQARMRGRIDIPGDGTSVTYPVFFDDLITGILESAFGNHEEKVFYLFPKHGVTYLTLAHMIQKANPNVTIDFAPEDLPARSAGLPNVRQGKYLLSDKYNPQARIKKLDLEISNTLEDQKNEQLKMRAERSLSFSFKIFIFCFLFLLSLPLITTIFFSFLGFQSLTTLKTYLQKNEIDKAQKSANFAKTYFDLADLTSTPFLFEANFIGQGEKIEKLKDKIIQGQTISLGGIYFFNALKSNNLNSLKNALVIFQKEPESAKYFASDESLVKFASNTMSVWPQIAGFDEKKTYLVLFQDSRELRPTGGLIDSYGILKVVNGKVSDFKEYDVSDSDRKLTGHVEPPFAIRRYLSSPNWYLKDSNFNVDFPKAASASAFFLNIETGEAVDGVIGVVAPDLKSYFRRDTTFLGILRVLTKSINDKKVLFAFSDKNLQNLFSINGWSSSIREEKKNPGDQIADFLGINEANLGKNKANTSVKRKIVQNAAIDEKGSISEDVLISFQNEGPKDYKNYLRIILPLGSNLEKIEINNEKQDLSDAIINPEIYEASNFVPGKGLEIEKYNQDGKTVYGFLITVAKKDSKTIKINYTLSRKIIFPTLTFSYALYVFKQPGVDSYSHDFSLKVPESFRIVGSQKPEFQKTVSSDFDITFNFAQR